MTLQNVELETIKPFIVESPVRGVRVCVLSRAGPDPPHHPNLSRIICSPISTSLVHPK